MANPLIEDLQGSWICGQCGEENFYLLSEGPTKDCTDPDCGWHGGTMKPSDVPLLVKMDLNQFK